MANPTATGVLVIGLGRFGSALANALDSMDQEVLAIERDPALVERYSKLFPVVEADASDPLALEQAGVEDFGAAVVGVGTSLEASVLITGNLVDANVPEIWAKAISEEHGKILRRIGAHHVVLPESESGNRVAHQVGGRMLDYIEIDESFSIVKMSPPKETHNFSLADLQLRDKYGIQVIGVMSPDGEFEYGRKATVVHPDDVLVIGGDEDLVMRFANRP
ncbi:TrkA family potassium uptake protein [Demequina sp. NBRC 110053]|uniref:potassium channel family protein n=1 Tax=Demequina sp. NBRC 110053 TaxID=1570342 RepID=UPI0009FF0749|nr:TrkA family potassium uptake protein [Demequina sp. NBRC 110053]